MEFCVDPPGAPTLVWAQPGQVHHHPTFRAASVKGAKQQPPERTPCGLPRSHRIWMEQGLLTCVWFLALSWLGVGLDVVKTALEPPVHLTLGPLGPFATLKWPIRPGDGR